MSTEFEREFSDMLEPVTVGSLGSTRSSEGFPTTKWTTLHKTKAYIERQTANPFESGGSEQTETTYDGYFPIEDSSGDTMNLHSGLHVVETHVDSSAFGSSLRHFEISEESEDYIGFHQEVELTRFSSD